MATHLPVCPASVVHCTMEWNRWPVYSKERRARVPFSQSNIHARCGQLDVALALRDQRVLNDAMKVGQLALRDQQVLSDATKVERALLTPKFDMN